MSIEIDYLRKKAIHFRHRQIVGLVMTSIGLVVMVVTHFLIPILAHFCSEPWEILETYVTLSMATASLITFWGITITIYYSRKLSEFITNWSSMMEEFERRIREMEK